MWLTRWFQPQRAMTYIKATTPRDEFETAFEGMWQALWGRNEQISDPKVLAQVLSRTFPAERVKSIMTAAASPEYKQKLNESTQTALDRGAFGAPWFWVRNSTGQEEPFFGSDR